MNSVNILHTQPRSSRSRRGSGSGGGDNEERQVLGMCWLFSGGCARFDSAAAAAATLGNRGERRRV